MRPLLRFVRFGLLLLAGLTLAAGCSQDGDGTQPQASGSGDESTISGSADDAAAATGSGDDANADPGTGSDDRDDGGPTDGEEEDDTAQSDGGGSTADQPDRSPMEVITGNCASCHTGGGPGAPHLELNTVNDLLTNGDIVIPALETGFMPPWPASDDSVAFHDAFNITPTERTELVRWLRAEDTQAGADQPIVATTPVRRLENPDAIVTPTGSYDGVAFQPDEYRCLIYDPELTEPTWLTGYEFVPDQTEVVHHAIGYLADETMRDDAEALDAAQADQGGWSCFGGPGLGNNEIFLGWAPGQGPTRLPQGSGMRLEPGDFLIVQIHYHFEVDAPPDRSTLRLQFAPDDASDLDPVTVQQFAAPAEIPCRHDETGPLCDRETAKQAAIDKYGPSGVLADQLLFLCGATVADFAGMTDGVANSRCDIPVRTAGAIVSVLGHQHELGQSVRLTLNPETADELVLLDIPEWRFEWQLSYYPRHEIVVQASDVLRLECAWDRGHRDPSLEPAYVLWADGTDDEMCFATMAVRETS